MIFTAWSGWDCGMKVKCDYRRRIRVFCKDFLITSMVVQQTERSKLATWISIYIGILPCDLTPHTHKCSYNYSGAQWGSFNRGHTQWWWGVVVSELKSLLQMLSLMFQCCLDTGAIPSSGRVGWGPVVLELSLRASWMQAKCFIISPAMKFKKWCFKAQAFHVANTGLICGTIYGLLSTEPWISSEYS